MKKIAYILSLIVLVASCKKEPLPDVPEDTGAYYKVDGYVDGEHKTMEVGQEGVHISQGTTNIHGIKYYFGQIVSSTEDLLIRVEIAAPEIEYTPEGLTPLHSGSLSFLVHQPGCKQLNFGSNILQNNFLQIQNEQGVFEATNEISFDRYGKKDVTLKFTDVSQNSFTIPVFHGFDSEWLDPGFSTYPNADSVIFSADDQFNQHEWYLDGALVSEGQNFNMSVPMGVHRIRHKVIDQYGNFANETTLIRITDYVLDWQMTVSDCTGSAPNSNYGAVIVSVLTDGNEYRSSYALENLQKSFIMNDVEYVGNSSLQATRSVFDINFDAVVVNEDHTDSLTLSDFTGTFNVGLQ